LAYYTKQGKKAANSIVPVMKVFANEIAELAKEAENLTKTVKEEFSQDPISLQKPGPTTILRKRSAANIEVTAAGKQYVIKSSDKTPEPLLIAQEVGGTFLGTIPTFEAVDANKIAKILKAPIKFVNAPITDFAALKKFFSDGCWYVEGPYDGLGEGGCIDPKTYARHMGWNW
jgi:hypothetical protein